MQPRGLGARPEAEMQPTAIKSEVWGLFEQRSSAGSAILKLRRAAGEARSVFHWENLSAKRLTVTDAGEHKILKKRCSDWPGDASG